MRKPEPASDQTAVAENVAHLLRARVGCDIEILRMHTEQQITHSTTDKIGLETGVFQPVKNLQRVIADLGAGDSVLGPGEAMGSSVSRVVQSGHSSCL